MPRKPRVNPGARVWLIADGYLPSTSTGRLPSHESTCVLNVSARRALVGLTVYFEDREPLTGFAVTCAARRTLHIRLDSLTNGEGQPIPRDTPFALKVESNIPIVVQHTRLDSTQSALALMTTMAYPARG